MENKFEEFENKIKQALIKNAIKLTQILPVSSRIVVNTTSFLNSVKYYEKKE